MTNYEVMIEDFMLYCSSKNLSKKTLGTYEQTLKLFADYLKNFYKIDKVKDVTKSHIRQYIKYLQERGKYTVREDNLKNNPTARRDYGKEISNNTINNYIRNIKVFLNWLYDEEEIEKNPVEKIKLLKEKERLKPLLTEQEIKQIVTKIYLQLDDKMISRQYQKFSPLSNLKF